MTQKLFKIVFGALIFCALLFANIANACAMMADMPSHKTVARDITDHKTETGDNHACDPLQATTGISPEPDQPSKEAPGKGDCCDYQVMMPCEATPLTMQVKTEVFHTEKAITQDIKPAILPQPQKVKSLFLLWPGVHIPIKSQDIYLQTSRLRI